MLSPEFFTFITISVYLAATVVGLSGLIWRRGAWRKLGCWLALACFVCQTLVLIFGFHKLLPQGLSLGAYVQLLVWFFLLCGIIAWQRMRQDAILLFAAPLGLILFLMSSPWLHLAIQAPPSLTAPFYAFHIGALFFAIGLLALAFLAGLIFLFAQGRIKGKKRVKGIWEDMPALALLDKINSVCSICAFPLYTLGLVAGLVWAKPVFGATFTGDPKELISIFIWALLGALFYNRLARGWQGRKPAIMAIVIFILCVFSIIFVNLYLSTHHGVIRS